METSKVEITRKVEVMLPDGTWEEKDFMNLVEEDIVRMFEADGTPVCLGMNDKTKKEYFEAFVTKGVYANQQKEFENIPTFEYMEIT